MNRTSPSCSKEYRAAYQRKCRERLREIRVGYGRTINGRSKEIEMPRKTIIYVFNLQHKLLGYQFNIGQNPPARIYFKRADQTIGWRAPDDCYLLHDRQIGDAEFVDEKKQIREFHKLVINIGEQRDSKRGLPPI